MGLIISYQIVLLVIIDQIPGAHSVILTVPPEFLFTFYIPSEIMKPELLIKILRIKNNIYHMVDAFRHVLDPPRHMNVPFQKPGIILTHEVQQLLNQNFRLLFGYEF